MTAELHFFPGEGRREPTAVLEIAKQANLTNVLVIGWDQDGRPFRSTSFDQVIDILWLLEKTRYWFDETYFKGRE